MPFYIYICPNGHRSEARAGYEDTVRPCGECELPARRLTAYASVALHTETGVRFQPDHKRFIDRAAYIEHAYEKAEQEVGGYVKRPKWFNAGIARARSRAIKQGDGRALKEVCDLAKKADANRST